MFGWLVFTAFLAEPTPIGDVALVEPAAQTAKIDILIRQPSHKCEAQSAEEIVVCAEKTDNESHRLRPLASASIYDQGDSKAEFGISENIAMAAEAKSNQLGGGVVSKAIMARLKVKF